MGRAFIENGVWRGLGCTALAEKACDAAVQQKATLRVSALAGAVTLALLAGPDKGVAMPEPQAARVAAVSAPEMVSVKPADRVPHAGEIAPGPARRKPSADPAAEAPAPPAITPGIEIVDAATLRSGAMTVRIAGIALPAADRTCRRLDGLAVACIDRASSYLELLVRGRAVACDRAGQAEDGVDLGRCRIGDTDVAEQIIRQGWAEASNRDEPRLVTAEAAARRQKLGIWRE